MDRYAQLGSDHATLVCRDCSTRITVVTIDADERAAHDNWHAQGGDAWIPWDA